MQDKIDLKKIEYRTFTFSFQDGLFDILLGCIFLQFSIAPIIGDSLWNRGLVSHHGFPLMFGIISIGFVLIGIILLVKFLKNNSVPVSEENNAIR